jgi:hypothetical protein
LIKTYIKFGKVAGLIDESRPKDKIIIATYDFFEKFNFQEISVTAPTLKVRVSFIRIVC